MAPPAPGHRSPVRRFLPARRLTAIVAAGLIGLGCSQDNQLPTAPDTPSALQQDALKPAINVQLRHTDRLLAIPGVVGTAVGVTKDGRPTVTIFTEHARVADLPRELDGYPVTVKVTGMFMALTDPTARQPRPVPTGVSTGHPTITAGTIGARVKDASGNVFALSNNHVYAASNDAQLGDPVIQPGTYDGGQDPADRIGELYDFEPIDFSGGDNIIDAAIAVSSTAELGNSSPADDGYGIPNPQIRASYVGQKVQKYGRTTKLTHGEVSEVNVTVNVCYEVYIVWCTKLAKFVGQTAIVPTTSPQFSSGGDSGSLIVTDDAEKNPVGLLFAGSDTHTLANPIGEVLGRFSVTIDGEEPTPPDPVTDIAIADVSAPSSATVGDAVAVDVTVQNTGNQDVGTDLRVTLTDDTDGANIGEQVIAGGLTAGGSTVVSFSWATDAATTGDHTLTASHDFADDDATNDSNSATVTLNSAPTPVTDVAVAQVSAPSSANQGDIVAVDVTVSNTGNQDVTVDITVTLRDETDGVAIGTQTIDGGLAAGASTVLGYSWDTGSASTGDHTLTANHDFADDDAGNDANSATVSLNAPPEPAATVHSGDLFPYNSNEGRTWTAYVIVTVHDDAHTPVEGAIVYGSWTDGGLAVDECTTDYAGECLMLSTSIRKNIGSVTFSVTDVTYGTLTYDPTANHDPDGDSDGTSITVNKP